MPHPDHRRATRGQPQRVGPRHQRASPYSVSVHISLRFTTPRRVRASPPGSARAPRTCRRTARCPAPPRGRAVQGRLGAFGGGQHAPGDNRADRPRHPPPDVGGHHARVQRVRGDPGTRHPAGKFLREQHVAQLGDRVLGQARQAAGETPARSASKVDALGRVVGVAGTPSPPGQARCRSGGRAGRSSARSGRGD